MFLSIEILGVQCQRSVNEIENALVMPVEDPASNNILHSTLEVCNTCGHQKKTEIPFNCVHVFHFQKAQHRFHRIVTRCGCRERVAEDMYRTSPAGHDCGVRSSYGARTSSAGAAHDDDDPDLGVILDTTMDALS
jgi:hypothetical protein